MLTNILPFYHPSKDIKGAHEILVNPSTTTESVTTLCSPKIKNENKDFVFGNGSTKTIVPLSAEGNMLERQQKYNLHSPSLLQNNTHSKLSGTNYLPFSGKTAVSNKPFSNGFNPLSELPLFGVPESYKVFSNHNYNVCDVKAKQYVDKYNISSPGINNSDIYEEISFNSNDSPNLQLHSIKEDNNLFLDEVEESPLRMIINRNKVVHSLPDTSLHQERFITADDAYANENIEEVLKSVRRELLFKDENIYSCNNVIFGQSLNKKDYQMDDADKLKHILSFEMGYKNNFISEKIKEMEDTLYSLRKDMQSPVDFVKCYINSFVCSNIKTNYFLLKESIYIAKKAPWCLFNETFWANYEEDNIPLSKPVLLEYPNDHESIIKLENDFQTFLEKEAEKLLDEPYQLETI